MGVKCLHCNSEAVMEGKIYNQIDYYKPPAYFRPKSTFYDIFNNIKLENVFYACPSCGLVWTRIDDQRLQTLTSTGKII